MLKEVFKPQVLELIELRNWTAEQMLEHIRTHGNDR